MNPYPELEAQLDAMPEIRHLRALGQVDPLTTTLSSIVLGRLAQIPSTNDRTDRLGPRRLRAAGVIGVAASVCTIALIQGTHSMSEQDPTQRSGAIPQVDLASCAHDFSTAGLEMMTFAFDGVVEKIDSETLSANLPFVLVRFRVLESFAGDKVDEVTVVMRAPQSVAGEADQGPSFSLGTRMLVSGFPSRSTSEASGEAATCGFTRYYDKASATVWRQALTRNRRAP